MVALAGQSCMTNVLMSCLSPKASLVAVTGEGTAEGWHAKEVLGLWEARQAAGGELGEEKSSLHSTRHQGSLNESKEERLAYRVRA